MKDQVDDETVIKQYLLGKLPEEDQRRLEERLLMDDDYFHQLLAIESELVDEYLGGGLDAHEREKFETHFLSTPARHQELRFAKTFKTYISTKSVAAGKSSPSASPATHTSSWRAYVPAFMRGQSRAAHWALAFTLLVMVFGGWWMIAKMRGLQAEVEQLRAVQSVPQPANTDSQRQLSEERARAEQLHEELQRERNERAELEKQLALAREQNNSAGDVAARNAGQTRSAPQRSGVFAILLSAGMTRGAEGMQKASIPRNAASVRLLLQLETDEYRSYRAVLQTAEGNEVLVRDNLGSRMSNGQKTVALTVPATLLTRRDYLLTLSGVAPGGAIEKIGTYTFRILGN